MPGMIYAYSCHQCLRTTSMKLNSLQLTPDNVVEICFPKMGPIFKLFLSYFSLPSKWQVPTSYETVFV